MGRISATFRFHYGNRRLSLYGIILALCCIFVIEYQFCRVAEAKSSRKIQLFTTIEPILFILEKVAGNKLSTNALIKSGDDPHTFEATPRTILQLSHARVLFYIDAPFERSLVRQLGAFKNLKLVNLSSTIEKATLTAISGSESKHKHTGSEHQCDHTKDNHIWLAPLNIIIMASKIKDTLCSIDPVNSNYYHKNHHKFTSEVNRLNSRLKTLLAPFANRVVLVFHPAFGYFTRSYGLRQIPLESDGKKPTPRQLFKFVSIARTMSSKVIFVQPQFDRKSADILAKAIEGRVLPLDPLKKNILDNLTSMAEVIKASFR